MLNIDYKKNFLKFILKIKNEKVKEQIKKQVEKIIENPEIGKPMRHSRKGSRELYVAPYRLAYSYDKAADTLVFLDIYHKDQQ